MKGKHQNQPEKCTVLDAQTAASLVSLKVTSLETLLRFEATSATTCGYTDTCTGAACAHEHVDIPAFAQTPSTITL